MSYSYEEVREASIRYFNGDELAAEVFAGKYALTDPKSGRLLELTPDDMHKRLAKEFARIEVKYPNPMSENEIYELLASWKVVPQGSPMSAIGNQFQFQSLSNCFVIESPQDSYGGILRADQEQAQIMKRRGGVGFDVSDIRPRGRITSNAARTTDGIGVFMERFSNTCREVAQGGRRGALMLTIDVHHPEIRTFINIKRDLKKVTGANISIRVSDEFMNAVKNDEQVQLRFPVQKDVPHQIEEMVDAKSIWNEMMEAAWSSAEPGVLFWDTVTREGPADCYPDYQSKSTNPCGEITLSPYDSCRLMLMNLSKFVRHEFHPHAYFDYEDFSACVQKAQRLMDDLVDLELEAVDKIIAKIETDPEPDEVKRTELLLWQKIRKAAAGGRRTGLGITALGDCLAMLGCVYGDDRSINMTDSFYKSLASNACESSINMAKERGAFPVFDYDLEKDNRLINAVVDEIYPERCDIDCDYERYGRRNIALTTTAPAGSVSVLTQTTSGCEPAFMLSYKRRRKITAADLQSRVDFVDAMGDKWQEYTVYHHGFKRWMDVTGKTEADIKESPYYGATANEIDWIKKVDMQAVAQKWICHSISNTTNLPKDTPLDVVKQIYMRGWEKGCKGITIYRDGCRDGVLVSNEPVMGKTDRHAPKRPKGLDCDIHRTTVNGVPYLVLVGIMDSKPYEVFCGLQECIEIPKKAKTGTLTKRGKVNGISPYDLTVPIGEDDSLTIRDVVSVFNNPEHGAITRVISLSLRHGVPMKFLVEQLKKDKNSDLQSFSSAITRVLKNYIVDGEKASEKICGQCGADGLAYQAGCVSCSACGWSKC